jgi:hypothetical protein
MPSQVLAASVLFGVAACGVLAGINFARLGKRQAFLPSVVIGLGLFLVEAWLLVALSSAENVTRFGDSAAKVVGLLFNLVVGVGFMLVQKPVFDEWKADNWAPVKIGDRYKPTRVGLLFLVALVALAFEVGIVILFAFLAGRL